MRVVGLIVPKKQDKPKPEKPKPEKAKEATNDNRRKTD